MKLNCAPVCESCEQVSVETRCRIDPEAPNAWKPGDLEQMFLNVTTLPENQQYKPKILSRPVILEGDDPSTSDYKVGPWIVVLENFVTDEECDRLIELGAIEGYKRSTGVGTLKPDGTIAEEVNDGRTSLNAWCQDNCDSDPLTRSVMGRIVNLTGIPEENSEALQLLQYKVGQYYRTHHDYVRHQVTRQQGVRLLTVFLYLNDVEAGGGTNFPMVDITGELCCVVSLGVFFVVVARFSVPRSHCCVPLSLPSYAKEGKCSVVAVCIG
jgi:prolyl 4-hydroxylase